MHIPIKEALNNAQIVETILMMQLENKQGNSDNFDKELPKISASEELDRLKNFILFVEQQIDNNFFDDDYFSDDNYFSDYERFSDNYYSSPNDIITN
ncbi:581_t:CDS:2 [Cetraspora pellucida]|uniref:581_t:CDS:1 n=1 Tax=Cetraspora pellucida TaxID=1433469 RepID=A0A9N9HSM8_9GLOM|nr:581_t:CDS:2 [Cetraspora pellucida]